MVLRIWYDQNEDVWVVEFRSGDEVQQRRYGNDATLLGMLTEQLPSIRRIK